MNEIILHSIITCPQCGHQEEEIMPTDFCQWFYNCKGCATVLRPRQGDCCVFCSFGTVKCPPMQLSPHTRCC
ncbi:MAG: GDCCVxC domain-containing (seleno)protein [Sideroxyarcus sp.]|nr:GDCCVxC domain-containing (seleno)protein [Sideroxyarcus sp.]